MLGTIVNTVCIIAGSSVGALLKRGIKEKYQKVMFTAMGLATLALGANTVCKHLPNSQYPVLFIVSLAVGGIIGTALDLDGRVNRFAEKNSSGKLAQGLTTATLLYCIGTFSIVGPMLSALQGDNTFLYTNSTLDLVTSAIFAGTYGIGMILAAPILFCWQGGIYLLALTAGPVISDDLLTELSVIGGALITGSGLGILELKNCKILNLIPALAVPPVFFLLKALFA